MLIMVANVSKLIKADVIMDTDRRLGSSGYCVILSAVGLQINIKAITKAITVAYSISESQCLKNV